MTDDVHDYWQQYTQEIAKQLGLGHWDIRVSRQYPTNGDALASISCWYGQNRATVKFCNSFFHDYSPEEQRRTVAHEVVHIFADRMQGTVEMAVDGDNDEKAPPWYRFFYRDFELMVDQMAVAVSPFLPLPAPPIKPPSDG